MDIVNLPTSISQEDLDMLRTWVTENPAFTEDFLLNEDSQASHVSDAEVLFGTLTTSIVKSPRCDNINSHEAVRLRRESSIMGRRGTVSVYNAVNTKLGNLGPPLDEPLTTILDDGVARIDAMTLDVSGTGDQEVPLQLTLYGSAANRLKCQDIFRGAEIEFERTTEPTPDMSPDMSLDRSPGTTIDRSPQIDLTRSHHMSLDRSPERTIDRSPQIDLTRSHHMSVDRPPETATMLTEIDLTRSPEIDLTRSPDMSFDNSLDASFDRPPDFLFNRPPEIPFARLPGTIDSSSPLSLDVTPGPSFTGLPLFHDRVPGASVDLTGPDLDILPEPTVHMLPSRILDRLAQIDFFSSSPETALDSIAAINFGSNDQTEPVDLTTHDSTTEQLASWYTNFEPNPHIAVDSHREIVSHDEMNSDIDRVFETLNEGDKTSEQEPAEAVGTPLYPHQKQALCWMMSRENGDHLPPFCEEKTSGEYRNTLLNFSTTERPPSIRGGILADDMGLGKTLETIALILTNFVHNRPLVVPVPGKPRRGKENKIPSEDTPEGTGTDPENKVKVENNNDEMFQRLQKVDELVTKMEAEEQLSTSETANPCTPTTDIPPPTVETKSGLLKLRLLKADSSNIENNNASDPGTETVEQRVPDTSDKEQKRPILSMTSPSRKAILIDIPEQPSKRKRRILSSPSKYEESKWRKLHLDRPPTEQESHSHPSSQDTVTDDSDRKTGEIVNMDDSGDSDTCMQDITDGVSKVKSEDVDTDDAHPICRSDAHPQNTCEETPLTFSDEDELPDVENKEEEEEEEEEAGEVCDADSDMKDFMTANRCDERGRTLSEDCYPRGTLIICPLSVMSNWQGQFEEHAHPNVHIDVHLYYGNQRCKDVNLLKQKDVVITTYGILLSEFKEYLTTGLSPLMTIEWLRVVLDEGHCIRNPKAKQTKAVLTLQSQRKWVLTGTPIQNRMLDLWPLISFLNVTPLNERHWWQSLLEKPLQRGKRIAFKRVQHLMGNIAMRRTKNTLVDGEPLVKLPKREVYMERIKMSDEESRRYKSMEEQGKVQIKNYVRNNMLLKKYILVLEIMLRLRQMCCHSYLLPANGYCLPCEDSDSEDEDSEKKREKLVDRLKVISESEEECSVCVDVLKTPVILPCAHYFCQTCILNAIKHMEHSEKGSATCPLCRASISEDQIIDLPMQPEPQIYGDWKSSTKVDALMSALVNMRSEDPSQKSLVVSQFTSFLTLVETPLRELKFGFVRLDGKMSAPQRMEAVKKFSDTEPGSPTIFLISLRAGGVGLNLTAASRVFLMEPHWNPATEEQCFDRCHRLGQTKDVVITKFISEDTIEDRMLDLQEKKRMLMQQSFKKKQTATERNEQRTRDIRNLMNIL
ncbi:helicase-like transcription factor [Haliotis cracherodii]|uniref:helicase-like transcription factor n=1 Tax=Haliotis cracherodii TaxID=6455 RepID=UPI0039E7C580